MDTQAETRQPGGMSERLSDPASLAGHETAPACTLVIFGGGGDLTKRLLMPSIYNLRLGGLLADGFQVIGIDRTESDDEKYRVYLTEAMASFAGEKAGQSATQFDDADWGWVRERLHFQQGDFMSGELYEALKGRLQGPAIFYLAVAAQFFGPVIDRLADHGLMEERDGAYRRAVVEKPFGSDLASAQALNASILGKIPETQIYRIDHFLGKETVQNIMALRFSNGIFEPLWDRQHIDYVQITAAETVGVEARGKFYEPTGALRDMVPNHMFQLLAMVAMEPPNSFDADEVRAEKAKVIAAIKPFTEERVLRDVVRGQYAAGTINGRDVAAYRAEPDVNAKSETETFVAMRLKIDNWRWAGVPFYVRTGKRMAVRRTEIAVHFRQAPYAMFRDTPMSKMVPNVMVLHVQPEEGITISLSAKKPGTAMRLGRVDMDFRYRDFFKTPPSTGYETLLYDVMIGDATLFQRADNVEAGWAVVQPMLEAFEAGLDKVHFYKAGGSGPAAADRLLNRDDKHWLNLP